MKSNDEQVVPPKSGTIIIGGESTPSEQIKELAARLAAKHDEKARDIAVEIAENKICEHLGIETGLAPPTPKDKPNFLGTDKRAKVQVEPIPANEPKVESTAQIVLYMHSKGQIVDPEGGFGDVIVEQVPRAMLCEAQGVKPPRSKKAKEELVPVYRPCVFARFHSGPEGTPILKTPLGDYVMIVRAREVFDTPEVAIEKLTEKFPTIPIYNDDLGRYTYPNARAVMTIKDYSRFKAAEDRRFRRMDRLAKGMKKK